MKKVRTKGYVPQRGDVVWITLNPQTGHEQAGRHPAVVLSPGVYNGKVGLAILCSITNQISGTRPVESDNLGIAVTQKRIRNRVFPKNSVSIFINIIPATLR